MAAIKDVAKLAGMSVSVVSKYLKNPKSVRKETLEKIEVAIETLHYIPSPIARSLRTKRTGMVAVVVPSIINPFFAELFEFIRQTCNKESLLAILQTVEDEKEIAQTIQSIQSRQVDGVILCFPDQEHFLTRLKDRVPNIPIATMNWHRMDHNGGNIIVDLKRGIYEVTSHLINIGCTRIGYIGGPAESTTSKEKFQGFLSALEKCGTAPFQYVDPDTVKLGKASMRFGHNSMREIHKTNPLIQAIVCENDALAIGCATYCMHQRIEIPRQLMITGFDDIPLAAMFEPPLTTVRLPIEDMGKCAVKMIQGQLEGTNKDETIFFDTKIILRETTY